MVVAGVMKALVNLQRTAAELRQTLLIHQRLHHDALRHHHSFSAKAVKALMMAEGMMKALVDLQLSVILELDALAPGMEKKIQ